MDKAKLLAQRGPSYRDVEVDVGTVRVRGLTRAEVKACRHKDESTSEVKIITAALVDPADLTEAEVFQWLEAAPAGDYVAVMQAITELSGLSEGADKSGVPTDR